VYKTPPAFFVPARHGHVDRENERGIVIVALLLPSSTVLLLFFREVPVSLAEEIKRLRTVAGLTQDALAEKIGVTQSAITQLETGRMTDVSTATLYALSDALSVGCDHWREFLASDPIKKKKKKKKKK
jgi:DNA-binding XRE family transcriptional regulator